MASPSLDHYAWRMLKRKHKAHSKSRRASCWLAPYGMCLLGGVPIDYDHPGLPQSYETDHRHSRHDKPELWLEWNNLAASHQRCNRARGAKVVATEQVWVRPKF